MRHTIQNTYSSGYTTRDHTRVHAKSAKRNDDFTSSVHSLLRPSDHQAPADRTQTFHLAQVPRDECLTCHKRFRSRNSLFVHLRTHGHGVFTRNLSPFLQACQDGNWCRVLALWDSHQALIDVNESTDTGQTALHFLAQNASIDQSLIHLAVQLVNAGASPSALSRPDSIWGNPDLEGLSTTPFKFAREQLLDPVLLRAFAGCPIDVPAPDCECCGDEFVLCCDKLEPPLPGCAIDAVSIPS